MSKRGMLFKLDSSNYENFLLLLVLWTVITLEFRHSTPTKEDDLEIGKDRDQIFTAILLLGKKKINIIYKNKYFYILTLN